jgi:hypothetical protein
MSPMHDKGYELNFQPIDRKAREVYQWILERGCLDIELALEELPLSREQLTESVGTLLDLKLLRANSRMDHVVPRRPDMAAAEAVWPLEDTILKWQRTAHQVREEFDDLMSVYLTVENRKQHAADAIDTLPDRQSLDSLLDMAANSCTTEVLIMQPGGGRPREEFETSLLRYRPALDRGVRVRTLYQHSARFDVGTRTHVEESAEWGAECRMVPELTDGLVVVDGSIAFTVAAQPPPGLGAVVVRNPALVAFFCRFFERFWENGTPYTGEAKAPDDERVLANAVRGAIIRMLVQGARDETIARRLGISVRTCRRHVAELMEQIGAKSRLQAGYLLAGRQLLDGQD